MLPYLQDRTQATNYCALPQHPKTTDDPLDAVTCCDNLLKVFTVLHPYSFSSATFIFYHLYALFLFLTQKRYAFMVHSMIFQIRVISLSITQTLIFFLCWEHSKPSVLTSEYIQLSIVNHSYPTLLQTPASYMTLYFPCCFV
jgi:hypothetical protein